MKKLFFILLAFASITTFAQQGDYDTKQRASYAIQTDSLFIYKTDTIPASDISYHEWSSDLLDWHKEKEANDQYLRISNDVKRSWVVIDYRSTNPYWLEGADDILYLNPSFTDKVFINATLLDSIWDLYVGGNINTDGYYFFGQDSLTHTNIYNGGTTDGWVLTASGDTAIWSPFAPGIGGRDTLFISRTDTIVNIDTILFAGDTIFNVDTIYVQGGIDTLIAGGGFYTARNVGIDGYGVLQDTTGNDFKFRNIATQDTFINVVLADSTLYLSWDGSGRRITAGIGLNGGGSLDNDVTINFDIPNGFPTFPPSSEVDASSDFLVIYDVSAGIHYKINPSEITGTSVDLFTDDVFRESNIDTLNLVAGTLMDIEYDTDGRVIFNANTSSPAYVHIPDAFIAYGNRLFTYDISEGTAMSADGAPASDWSNKKSFGRGNYIWTAVANTVYRYDIDNDTTISVTPSTTAITWLVNASDGVYAIASGQSYYIDTLDLTYVDYGNTGITGDVTAAISTVLDGDEYLLLYDEGADKHSYKLISSLYGGSDDDAWDITDCNLGADVHSSFGGDGVYWWLYDVNNRTKLMESGYLTSTSDNCLNYRADYMTYLVPSGETFTEGSADAIITLESSKPNILSTVSTSYNIVNTTAQAGDYTSTEAALDRGIYVAKDNTVAGNDYWYEQAVNDIVLDIHVQEQLISEGFLLDNIGANVLAGAAGGYTYFHEYDEDPKQFMQKQVYEVTNDLAHATAIANDVVFVYFDSNYTGSNPKDVSVTELIDLYTDSILRQEDIRRLNIVAGDGIQVDYSSDANVVIRSTLATPCEEIVACVEDAGFVANGGSVVCDTIGDYGALYNWYAATDAREITSSDDWVVPTMAQYLTLFTYAGISFIENVETEVFTGDGGEQFRDTEYWDASDVLATNEYGLNIIGAGAREIFFNGIDFFTIFFASDNYMWWMDLEEDAGYINYRTILSELGDDRYLGSSLRLLYTGVGTPTSYTGNDGKEYRIVQIGTQYWLAANLNETKYRNGDWITGYDSGTYTPISNSAWWALTTEAMCYYNDNEAYGVGIVCDTIYPVNLSAGYGITIVNDTISADTTILATKDDIIGLVTVDEVAQIVSDSIAATSGGCNYTVQTLTSNTDTLNVANGVNAILDISGNTTIRIEPTATCNTGNITVICDAAGYTLTFVGATMKFSPYVEATAGVITTTASAGALDVFSYYYDGTRIFINGTKAYE